jgi:hypothetical protein
MDFGDLPMDQKNDLKIKTGMDPQIQKLQEKPENEENAGNVGNMDNGINLENGEDTDKSDKLRSTVSLDREVLEKAKRYNIKVSRVCNTFLRTFLEYYERVAITLQGQSQGKGMDQQVIMRKLLLDLFV